MEVSKPTYISLKGHPEFSERWLHELLSQDASWLGLGELTFVGSEKTQPTGGRLDLLLADLEGNRRYTIELQLGKLDESHIVRAIEYWDVERRRYSQFEHVAVIVAEDITSRFLNVIGLLHHSIPLIAIQFQAVQVGDKLTLVATTVHDYLPPAAPEEDAGSLVDQDWWQRQSSVQSMQLLNRLFDSVRELDHNAEIRYTKSYVRVSSSTKTFALVMRPRKKEMVSTEFKFPEDEELTNTIEQSSLQLSGDYNKQYGHYHIRVRQRDFADPASKSLLDELLRRACGLEASSTAQNPDQSASQTEEGPVP